MYYINFIRNIMLLLMLPILTSCSTTYTYNPAIISAGQNHTMAIKEDGTLWGWGSDEAGQLGLGNNEEHIIINWSTDYLKYVQASPVKIMYDVSAVDSGWTETAAIKKDRTLWVWGANQYGQLGNGLQYDCVYRYTNYDNVVIEVPIQTKPEKVLEDVLMVSIGDNHMAAVKTDGSLWTWGNNEYGQLGNNSYESSCTPQKIMDNVKQAVAGANATYFIKNDYTLWSCGKNDKGQLGDGTKLNQAQPVKITKDVVFVDSSSDKTLLIKKDGSLWEIVIDGESDIHASLIERMQDVRNVSVGYACVYAVKKDGTLWGWGNNIGEIFGSKLETFYIENPTKIMDDVSQVSVGLSHAVAIKNDGSLWTWGSNTNGQLGSMGTGLVCVWK